MKILIISESLLEKIGENYYAIDPWICIPVSFANHCEKVTLWSPVISREPQSTPPKGSWIVPLGKLHVEPHDPYNRFIQYYRLLPKRYFAWRKKADRLIKEHDLVIMRAPGPITPLIVRSARRQKRPLVLMLLLNLMTQSDKLMTSRGLKRLLFSAVIKVMVWKEKQAVKRAHRVYVYSQELADRHRGLSTNLSLTQDPHLSLKDIVPREDTCQSDEIRLLRICWLIPSKGVEYLLKAVALLVAKGKKVRLQIVGQEKSPGYQASLKILAGELGIHEYVIFSGWAPFDKIGEVYLQNDIQILSSLGEGTPRCIVEGFARGLPLISTAVGGCKDTLTHEKDALLVPPGDPGAIARAVERLVEDRELRKKLIQTGLRTANSLTFENLGMNFLKEIQETLTHYQNARM